MVSIAARAEEKGRLTMAQRKQIEREDVWGSSWASRCSCLCFGSSLFIRSRNDHPPSIWILEP
jgi:hypothetical protein